MHDWIANRSKYFFSLKTAGAGDNIKSIYYYSNREKQGGPGAYLLN
jgi:hypothetical protein